MSKSELREFRAEHNNVGDPIHVVVSNCQIFVTHIYTGVVEILDLDMADDCVSSTITSWRG